MSDKLHLTCAACGRTNRLPAARLGDAPRCGHCQAPVLNGAPVELDAQGFDRFLARNDVPVVVDFWAPWCGPCRTMAPQFESAAGQLEPRARLAKLDTEQAQSIAARYDIRSIPTMIVFRGGQEVARQSGAMDAGRIRAFVEAAL